MDGTNTITLVLKNSLQTEEERNLSLVGRNSVSSPEIVNMSSERPPSTTIIQSKSHSPAQTRGDHRLQWNACLSKTFSSTWRYDNTNTESSNHTEPAITNDPDEDSLCPSLAILLVTLATRQTDHHQQPIVRRQPQQALDRSLLQPPDLVGRKEASTARSP
jgi:hypothetical protein